MSRRGAYKQSVNSVQRYYVVWRARYEQLEQGFHNQPSDWTVVVALQQRRQPYRRSRAVYATGQGFTRQMSAAYSAMVRSLENFPEWPTFSMAFRAHSSGCRYNSPTFSWARA